MNSHWKLTVIAGPDRGREFSLPTDRTFIVGRGSQSDTQIRDPRISRLHCEIQFSDSAGPILVDLPDGGGTFVDNQRAMHPTPLQSGTEFRIGASILRIDNHNSLDAPTLKPPTTAEVEPQSQPPSAPKSLSIAKLEGTTFLRFRLDKLVSVGRNSVIYKGKDVKRGRDVAVKILKPQMASSDTQRDRFIRAMRTMLPIVHPNIVRVRKAGRHESYCWAAFDWVEGQSVTKLIENIGIGGMLDWQEVWRVAVHIARALDTAHQHHIIHRNVSPSNILRRSSDRSFLLTDLIFARALENTDAAALTRPGDVLGELGYLAPEQIFDSTNVDERCDQYGLGATLYALLTGAPPHVATSLADYIQLLRDHKPKSPVVSQLGMDERFCDVVMRMIKKSPDQRFDSPRTLLKELERVGKLGGIEADWSDWI